MCCMVSPACSLQASADLRAWPARACSPLDRAAGLLAANVAGYILWQTHPKAMARHAVLSLQALRWVGDSVCTA